jgi:hypothetical protein
MRLLGFLSALCILAGPAPLQPQDWTVEGDLVLASSYEWRGLRLDPGANLQYSAYASVAWERVQLTAGAWSIADLSSGSPLGLPQRWGSEISPWVEAGFGGARNRIFLGSVGYLVEGGAAGAPLRREGTWEVYAGGRGALPRIPILGEAVLFWDAERWDRGYGEVAAALQIPLWVGSVVPLGSLFLEGRGGFALGDQSEASAADGGTTLYGETGMTHADVSLRTTLLPLGLGPVSASFTLATHWIRSLDEETERIGFQPGGPVDPSRWMWAMGMRLLFPRCRPERELCRDL